MKFLKRFIPKSLPPVEKWALANAHHATPDEIIVAAVVQSFAKNFRDWTGGPYIVGGAEEAYKSVKSSDEHYVKIVELKNEKSGVTITRRVHQKYNSSRYTYKHWYGQTEINGLVLSDWEAQEVLRAYLKVRLKLVALEEAAAKAKSNMERNEAAWNLAEKLLGMKRNEHGALVPVVGVEE